ncbi:MAG: hypothetical protein ACTSXL_05415 [Alphaproteobacteria bacterium]|nr:MAG: hypothetical protein B6I23_00620 [Rickettsiaceae bacterium 4572_127]
MKKILLLAFTVFLFSTNVFADETKNFEYDYGVKGAISNKCINLKAKDEIKTNSPLCKNDKEYIKFALMDAKRVIEADATRHNILTKIKDKVSQCANGSLSLFDLEDVKTCQEVILGNFCDNKKTTSKIYAKKCENKTKIAETINEKFSDSLSALAVKKLCDKILIKDKEKAQTNAVKLDSIKTSYIRKCRRGAKKYKRLEKKAKNVDGKSKENFAKTNCLVKADFKKIDKCIKKVKIQYKLNSDFADYLKRLSVKDACKKELVKSSKITSSWEDIFTLRDLKKCKKSVKKMKKLTSKAEKNKKADIVCLGMATLAKVKSCVKDFAKAKKVCKKLKRKIKKCNNCEDFSDNCETISEQSKLKKYEGLLKAAKEKLSADRKKNRTEKIKNLKKKFQRKKIK